eukprot:TRINITY_DN11502_c0_g1_i1.p1 TRINITY_DN11502_c0_g1~~TRINITY_DN11502_c0_g1_i1.p1  ORF type:complete len:236 (-),score=92.98 TRINITY_DN11502_c0_g1_i1:18-653(-)
MSSNKRGALILFEGIDRCGKSTQVQHLYDNLKNNSKKVALMRFPDRTTPIGQKINAYLTDKTVQIEDHVIHLLFSANRWEARNQIVETLNSGTSIVMDRYAYSGVAFTNAKGLDLQWCKNPDVGLPAPDAVIYLQISIEDAQKRGNYGEERYETVEFQRKVKKIFEEQLKDETWKVLDANQSKEELQKQILQIAEEQIEKASGEPIRDLWK